MKMIKHPILGDYQYGKNFRYKKYVPRHMLHSYITSFLHPYSNKDIVVKSKIPSDFMAILENKFCK